MLADSTSWLGKRRAIVLLYIYTVSSKMF